MKIQQSVAVKAVPVSFFQRFFFSVFVVLLWDSLVFRGSERFVSSFRSTRSSTSTRHEETNSRSTLTSFSLTCPVPVSAAVSLLSAADGGRRSPPCLSDLSIDAMDVAGEQQLDVEHNLFKQRLDKELKPVTTEAEKHGTLHSKHKQV